MADEPFVAEDREAIQLSSSREVAYWTGVLGVSEDQLRAAVEAVGPQAGEVRKYLNSGV